MSTPSARDGIHGIVLDAVGTLIKPQPPVAEVYAAAARRQGVVLDPAEVRARFHAHFRADERGEQRGPLATDEAAENRRWRRIVAQVLPGLADPERAFEELWDHFGRADAWTCFADVAGAVRVLQGAGLALGIASNFDARLRRVVRGLPALAGLAGTLVISSEVGYRKPHPAIYRAACARINLAPREVLSVGDDPENDVRGASRAGLRGVLVDRLGGGPDDLPRFADLGDLADWLIG
jgi:putative hydrolase of the HAD superfamily